MSAFLILSLRSAEQVMQLVASLYREDDLYAVHMDAKAYPIELAKLQSLCRQRPNIILLRSRPCSWGGFSLVHVELHAIERLLDLAEWEHLFLLSEQHYPVKHVSEFSRTVEPDMSYMDVTGFDDMNPIGQADISHRFARVYREFIGVGSFAEGSRTMSLSHIHHASQWAVLSRKAASYLVRSFRNNRRCWNEFETSLLPDETAFPTILMNASEEQRGRISHQCLTYVAWPDRTDNNDLIASHKTFQDAKNSSCLFVRKRPLSLEDFPEFVISGNKTIDVSANVNAPAHVETSANQGKIVKAIQSLIGPLEIDSYEGAFHKAYVLLKLRKSYWNSQISVMVISNDGKDFKIIINAGLSSASLRELRIGSYQAHVMKVRLNDIQGHYQVDLGRKYDRPIRVLSQQELKYFVLLLKEHVSAADEISSILRTAVVEARPDAVSAIRSIEEIYDAVHPHWKRKIALNNGEMRLRFADEVNSVASFRRYKSFLIVEWDRYAAETFVFRDGVLHQCDSNETLPLTCSPELPPIRLIST